MIITLGNRTIELNDAKIVLKPNSSKEIREIKTKVFVIMSANDLEIQKCNKIINSNSKMESKIKAIEKIAQITTEQESKLRDIIKDAIVEIQGIVDENGDAIDIETALKSSDELFTKVVQAIT